MRLTYRAWVALVGDTWNFQKKFQAFLRGVTTAKFFCAVVRTRLSPTQVDNVVTWDRAVMLATLMAGLELDFARIVITEIHEKAFKTTTTLPFLCIIFHLCRAALVTIWHCDRLIDYTTE